MIPMRHKDHQRQRRLQRALVALVLVAGAAQVPAEELPWGVYQEDPLWLAYAPQLKYIKLDVDATESSYKPAGGISHNWTLLTFFPAVGVQWKNYVYHPDLLNYSVLFEPGYYWQQSGASGSQSQTGDLMLNGSAMLNLLSVKPYATSVSFGRSHAEVQSDFFTTQTVDMQSWNVLSGYRDGPVPITLTFDQSEEDRSGYGQDYVTDQLRAGLHAVNDRKNGGLTILDYQFNQYDNQSTAENSSFSSESTSHHALLTDSEHFQKSSLSSTLNFNEWESQGVSSADLNASSFYNLEHTPNLRSFYSDSLNDSFGDGYNFIQDSLSAGLSHQLYDSLGSHLDLHGSYAENHSSDTTLDALSYGSTASVDYSKRLGDWAQLTVNNNASYDLTDQQSSGSNLVIPDESDTIPAVGPMIIRLHSPNVLSVTSVTKNNVALDPTEWTAITTTDPWQIQFFSGGAHSVANGDAIVITYVVQPNPSGNYSTFNYAGQIALRFWQGQAGVRAGYMTTENDTDSKGFVLQNVEQYQMGADATWHGFHADASYTDQRSSLYSYVNYGFSESYSLALSMHSTASIALNQQWNIFPSGSGSFTNQSQNLAFYSYMLHYDWHPAGVFNLNAEAGWQQQQGGLYDQDLIAARIYLNWVFNKLEIHLGYEHENRQYVSEVYGRDYVFLRMRRNF